jgi:polyisoprenoid-binding protein YceI
VKHFWGLITVRGHFERFEGTAVVSAEGATTASLSVDADSVQTKNARRDKHLRSADFFDAANHPTMTFAATQVDLVGDDRIHVRGELTAAGQTHPVEFDAALTASSDAATGQVDASFVIDRTNFGMTWSPLRMTASDVTVTVHLEFAR